MDDICRRNDFKTYVLAFKTLLGVNFTNNLQTAFVLISFRQKITNPNCKHRKAAQNTFVWKSRSWNVGYVETLLSRMEERNIELSSFGDPTWGVRIGETLVGVRFGLLKRKSIFFANHQFVIRRMLLKAWLFYIEIKHDTLGGWGLFKLWF